MTTLSSGPDGCTPVVNRVADLPRPLCPRNLRPARPRHHLVWPGPHSLSLCAAQLKQ